MGTNRKIIIGEGDDLIENWYHGFDNYDQTLTDYIVQASEYDLKVKWKVILENTFGKLKVKINFEPSSSLELYEFISDLSIQYDNWGGDSPGRSGGYIVISAYNEDLKEIKKELELLIKEIEKYWKVHGLAQIVMEQEHKRLLEEKETLLEATKKLENDILNFREAASEFKEKLQNAESEKKLLLNVMAFLNDLNIPFLCIGPILFTKGGPIYFISNHTQFYDYNVANNLLSNIKSIGFEIVEVSEYNSNGSQLSHIPHFAMSGLNTICGWKQTKTLLKSLIIDEVEVAKIRRNYISWFLSRDENQTKD